MSGILLVVQHEGARLKVTRTTLLDEGDIRQTYVITTDGSELTDQVTWTSHHYASGKKETKQESRKTSAKWKGKTLHVKYTTEHAYGTEEWQLSKDGSELIIELRSITSGFVTTQRLVLRWHGEADQGEPTLKPRPTSPESNPR